MSWEDYAAHAKVQIDANMRQAYDEAYNRGKSFERAEVIRWLKEYEKDSVVAKLLVQMMTDWNS